MALHAELADNVADAVLEGHDTNLDVHLAALADHDRLHLDHTKTAVASEAARRAPPVATEKAFVREYRPIATKTSNTITTCGKATGCMLSDVDEDTGIPMGRGHHDVAVFAGTAALVIVEEAVRPSARNWKPVQCVSQASVGAIKRRPALMVGVYVQLEILLRKLCQSQLVPSGFRT